MKALSRILCAVDIDDHARTTFAQALAIARPRDAKLLLVCAVSPDESFNVRATERVSYLTRLRMEAEAAGVEVHTSVQSGETAEIVLLHATARRPQLIVIGVEHGRADGRVPGSVAEDVLRSANCPTLVVPAGAAERSSFARVLSAVDLDADPVPSLDDLADLAPPPDAHLTMLHVARSRAAARGALPKVQSLIPLRFKSAALGRVAIGVVGEEVSKAARGMDAELIVIGARPRNRVARRLFGVTRELLTCSGCPVLAIPAANVAVRHPDRQAA